MENRTSLQDTFLNQARRSRMPVTVFMTNGFQQKGSVTAFDGYTILLHNEGRQYLLYKHAVSTICPLRSIEMGNAAEKERE